MKLAKLYNKNGEMTKVPTTLEGNLSFNEKESVAQFFDFNGKLIEELKFARVEWIEAGGIRISGAETYDLAEIKFRIQSWHVVF